MLGTQLQVSGAVTLCSPPSCSTEVVIVSTNVGPGFPVYQTDLPSSSVYSWKLGHLEERFCSLLFPIKMEQRSFPSEHTDSHFFETVSLSGPGWIQTSDPPASASHIPGILGVCQHAQLRSALFSTAVYHSTA